MRKFKLTWLFALFVFFCQAQDVVYTTADIIAGVTPGSTTATLTKSGASLTITKTGGTTTPLHGTYPTGAPLNTLPVSGANNIEGLHIGRTWGANGTGWIDAYGQLRSETYTFDFSADLKAFYFTIGAVNDNLDGIEKLNIVDVQFNGVSVLANVTFSIVQDFDDPSSDTIEVNSITRDIEGQGHPQSNGWNESSVVTITSTLPFNRVLFERKDYENTRPDKAPGAENYTNGLTITGFSSIFGTPEINVKGNNQSIVDGDATPAFTDSTHFGTIARSATASKTYWILNEGTDTLCLTGPNPVSLTGSSKFTVTSQPSGLKIKPGDSLSFVVNYVPTLPGSDTATVSIANDDSDENPYTFDVLAIAINAPPVAQTDSITVVQDTTNVSIKVQINDTDPDGDPLTTNIISGPSNGTVSVQNGDSLLYNPTGGFNGLDTILYSVCDPYAACDTDTVFITVTPVTTVIAVEDSATTNYNINVIVDVQVNDTGAVLTTTIITNGSNGTGTVLNGDSISYNPDNTFAGLDTIVYQVCDGSNVCDRDTVFITVLPDSVDANTDSVTTAYNTTVAINVGVNDTGNVSTINIITDGSNGTATTVNTGTVSYNPDNTFSGRDTVIYEICNAHSVCDRDSIFITILPDSVDANTDSVTTTYNTTVAINVGVNDTGNVTTINIITDGSNGTATTVNTGTVSYNPDNTFSGRDTVIYEICNVFNVCDRDSIFITILPDSVDANTDSITTDYNTTVAINVGVNDTGNVTTINIITDGSNGTATTVNTGTVSYNPDNTFSGRDTVIYEICNVFNVCDRDSIFIIILPDSVDANTDSVTTDYNTTVAINVGVNDTGNVTTINIITDGSNGTATTVNTGTVSYNPDNTFSGRDTVIYEICNAYSVCDRDSIFITILPDSVDANTDSATITYNTTTTINVGVNDTGNVTTINIITDGNNGTTTTLTTGTVSYNPDSAFVGTDTVIYEICNAFSVCDRDSIFITVLPDSVDANTDSVITDYNTTVAINVGVNDTGNVTTINIITDGSNGTATTVNTGTVSYNPDNTFSGRDTVIYEICNVFNVCDRDSIFITILPDSVDANTDSVTTDYNTTVAINVGVNDTGNVTTINIITDGSNGTATTVNTGTVSYNPDNTFSGRDTVIYEICNAFSVCDRDSIFITILPDSVDANTDSVTTPYNTTVAINVGVNDTGNVTTINIITDGSNGTATTVNTGTVSYNPDSTFSGRDTVIYEICNAYSVCDRDSILITILPDSVDAFTDSTTTEVNVVVVIDVQKNDGGSNITTTIITNGSNGTGTVVNGDSISYNPNNGFVGRDTLIYEICNPANTCDRDSVFVIILPDSVDANTDSATTTYNTTTTINVGVNDTGNVTTINIVTDGSNGTTTTLTTGTVSYNPDSTFAGTDTVIYEICNAYSVCDRDTIFITVLPDSVDANTDSITTTYNTTVAINVGVNDTGNVTTINIITDGSNGTATTVNTGTVSYNPDNTFAGRDTVIYEICNMHNVCDRDSIFITILPDSVDANTDSITVTYNTTTTINVGVNDTGNVTTINIITDGSNGTTTTLTTGTVSYNPDSLFSGRDTVIYEICNQHGVCDRDSIFVTVIADTIIANADSIVTLFNTTKDINVGINDTGNVNTINIIKNGSNGVVSVINTDSLRYNPDNTFAGKDTVIYEICNPSNVCARDSVFITVLPDTVIANLDTAIITYNTTTTINVGVNDTGNITNINIITDGSNGTTTTLTTGTVSYNPDSAFVGTDTVIYEICNVFNVCDRDSIIIIVLPDSVDANTDTVTTTYNTTTTINVGVNDTGNVTTINIITDGNNGTTTTINTGTVSYNPDSTFAGKDTVIYEICNLYNVCDRDTIFVTVLPDSVDANTDSITTTYNTTVAINVGVNDTGNVTTINIITDGSNGTATTVNTGTVSYNPDNTFAGRDTVIYEICNMHNVCDRDSIFITILPDSVDANTDSATVTYNTTTTINVGVNDTGNVTNINIITDGSNGVTTTVTTGTISFNPDSTFVGKDTIIYEICNVHGVCDRDTVFITVLPEVVDALTDSARTQVNIPVVIDVQKNDTGSILTTNIITNGSNGTGTVVNGDSISYNPNTGYVGKDTLIYEICNPANTCDRDTVFITILPDSVDANTDSVTVTYNTTTTINVGVNDTGNVTNINIITDGSNGTTTTVTTGTVSYNPDSLFSGKDTVIYEICNVYNICDRDTIFITVLPDSVDANTDSITTTYNTTVAINVGVNDTGNVTNINIITDGSNGTTTTINTGTVSYNPDNTFAGRDTVIYEICNAFNVCDRDSIFITILPDSVDANTDSATTTYVTTTTINVGVNDTGNVTTITIVNGGNGTIDSVNTGTINYTPDSTFTGKDTIIYEICNTHGVCDRDTVFITVLPEIVDALTDSARTIVNIPVVIDVQKNDTGTVITTNIITNGSNGTGTVVNGDSISYNPNTGYVGKDTLIYEICNPANTCDRDTVFITIVPDSVDANTDSATTTINIPVNINVGVNDTGNVTNITIVKDGTNGTATTVNTGTVAYNPDSSFIGRDTVIYEICNPYNVCDFDSIFVNIVQDSVDATTDTVIITEGTTVEINIAVNDTGNITTINIITNGTNGTGTIKTVDTIIYVPDSGFVGKDTIIYEVCNLQGICDIDTILITVNGNIQDLEVIALNDSITLTNVTQTAKDTIINVQINDTDKNGGVLTTTILYGPTSGGTATVVNGDSINYLAPDGFYGKDTISYIVCSSIGTDDNDCDTAIVVITIIPADCDGDGIANWEDSDNGCDFAIPQGFSPNADGVNDTWGIKGIYDYPNNKVKIFNRWGNLVYEKAGYDNSWDGTTMFGITVNGNDLPEGTYFYIVDLGNKNVHKGYVYLKR